MQMECAKIVIMLKAAPSWQPNAIIPTVLFTLKASARIAT